MKTFLVQVIIDAEISVEAENEAEARDFAENEAHSVGGDIMVSDVEIVGMEEYD